MDGDNDYKEYDDARLIDIVRRINARLYPLNFAKLKATLIERGYEVHEYVTGPADATPTPAKLRELTGLTGTTRSSVRFGPKTGLVSWLEPARNDYRLVGAGSIEVSGLRVRLTGRRFGAFAGLLGLFFRNRIDLDWHRIANVEYQEDAVRFDYQLPDWPSKSVILWMLDPTMAQPLADALPKVQGVNSSPQLSAQLEFERRLEAQAARPYVTYGLLAANVLVFLIMAIAGAGWLSPDGNVHIAWGSNFGPYTTDGEWWRLFTSMFVHFGLVHLAFNMWALGSFGPMAERLFGNVAFLLIYVGAGVVGSIASIWWRPDINSAGASGAIFGILGGLIASQLRAGDSIPAAALRPLRNSTLVFTVCAFLGGLGKAGIDNADHLGGLVAGFLLGLALARPVTGDRDYSRVYARRLVQVVPVVALALGVGVWCAARASASIEGERQYFRARQWFAPHEREATDRWVELQNLARSGMIGDNQLADRIESEILPFWQSARLRLAKVALKPESKYEADLEFLEAVADGRAHEFGLLVLGARQHDMKVVDEFKRVRAETDRLIAEHNGTSR